MKKILFALGLLAVGLVGASALKADSSSGYYTTISTGVIVSTRANFNITEVWVSTPTGAGVTDWFILVDSNPSPAPNASFVASAFPESQWITPPIMLSTTTDSTRNRVRTFPGDGVSVKKGLVILGGNAGNRISVYMKPQR